MTSEKDFNVIFDMFSRDKDCKPLIDYLFELFKAHCPLFSERFNKDVDLIKIEKNIWLINFTKYSIYEPNQIKDHIEMFLENANLNPPTYRQFMSMNYD